MAGTSTTAPRPMTIDVMKDLSSGSHLRDLLNANYQTVFALGGEMMAFLGKPISAVLNAAPLQITVQAPGNWTTSSGIGFSLSGTAKCSMKVEGTSTPFAMATSIGSSQTENFVAGPANGKVFINLEMDFAISGNVSGSGTVGALGISGSAAGSSTATVSYCHCVDANMETAAAILQAFQSLVFPFQPDCALKMPVGCVGRVSFDACLGFQFDASYGFGSWNFAAPSVDSARQSMVMITLPSVAVNSGATAHVDYNHADHFTAIVWRDSEVEAQLRLLRSADSEFHASAGIKVGVTISNLDIQLNQQELAGAVNHLVGAGGDQAVQVADQIQSSLVAKTNAWLANFSGTSSLMVSLSRQHQRALLYKFAADLTKSDLTQQSWMQFAKGDLRKAVQLQGLRWMPGSGVSDEMQRSVSIGLQFFNLFSVTDTNIFFRNAYAEVGPDGDLEFHYDIGREKDAKTKNAMKQTRLHFVATAQQTAGGTIHNPEVDLVVEMSESGNSEAGKLITNAIGSSAGPSELKNAQNALLNFLATNPRGALNVVDTLKPGAFQKISCSAFSGSKPPVVQTADQSNWEAFRSGAETLMNVPYIETLTYETWQRFNEWCNEGQPSPGYVPNRRHIGSLGAIYPGFYGENLREDTDKVTFFLLASTQFMNLCDDLHSLAGLGGESKNSPATWDTLLDSLTSMVKNDANLDWSKAAVRALLQLCSGAILTVQVTPGDKAITCGVTIA